MSKRRLLVATIVAVAAILFFWQLPVLLKAMPSRYMARLPEPVQALGQRDDVPLLPTVAAPVDAAALLIAVDEPTALPTVATELATLPPPPVTGQESTAVPSATPSPTAVPTNTPLPIPASLRLDGFTHQFQTWNNCGPATIAMALSYYGMNLDQSETAPFLKPNPEDRNVSPYQMAAYVNEQTPYSAIDRTNGDLETISDWWQTASPPLLNWVSSHQGNSNGWAGTVTICSLLLMTTPAKHSGCTIPGLARVKCLWKMRLKTAVPFHTQTPTTSGVNSIATTSPFTVPKKQVC